MYRYHTVEESLVGKPYVKEAAYNLEEVIVLNLGDAEYKTECEILNLLNTLFSDTVRPEEKKKVLSEEYNIAMTTEMDEEVYHMCNLSTAISRKSKEEGIVEGREEGNFESTARYCMKGRITPEEAASDLGMTLEEFQEKLRLYNREKSDKK